MVRDKIKKIISDIENEVKVERLVDSSIEFEDVVLKGKVQEAPKSWKSIIKYKILDTFSILLSCFYSLNM